MQNIGETEVDEVEAELSQRIRMEFIPEKAQELLDESRAKDKEFPPPGFSRSTLGFTENELPYYQQGVFRERHPSFRPELEDEDFVPTMSPSGLKGVKSRRIRSGD